ncbi:MAG TPA: tRNA (adenosine(37)-N6)-threonylcarbamoyltransferase complex transferase subunit TsaD [Clostridia bacterium]|nr:tRNA (adenosine(37)-N6)-threonylcarbamoyltransferase complex transferase subunit TsaD [Clostridia bacterium]
MGNVILGVETSCDETAASVVVDGSEMLSNVVSSQIDIHRKFGGVVPEVASRKHIETINGIIDEAIGQAGLGFSEIDGVAVTYGPGLVGALLVGLSSAKALAYAIDRPLIGVNHIEGHIYANFLINPDLKFPLICLVVSGGHTDLVFMPGHGRYEYLGGTRDDAAGEAFDKVARFLKLGYPGGPAIERLSFDGDPNAVGLPRAYLEKGSFDFSFSGLKTAVLNYHSKHSKNDGLSLNDLAASFQQAVVDVLVDKTVDAAKKYRVETVLLAGGVAANLRLREELSERITGGGFDFSVPPLSLCTDNAAMIACAGGYRYDRRDFAPLTLNAYPRLDLGVDRY